MGPSLALCGGFIFIFPVCVCILTNIFWFLFFGGVFLPFKLTPTCDYNECSAIVLQHSRPLVFVGGLLCLLLVLFWCSLADLALRVGALQARSGGKRAVRRISYHPLFHSKWHGLFLMMLAQAFLPLPPYLLFKTF